MPKQIDPEEKDTALLSAWMECWDSPRSLSERFGSNIKRKAARQPNTNKMLHLAILASLLKVTAAADTSSACSSSSSSSASRRLGGTQWYCEDYEKDHLEAVCAAVLIVLAVLFEHVYHYLHHEAEHGFRYGQSMLTEAEKHALVIRNSLGKPLRLMLFVRCSGEFMVLGFLAFTIWTCNQQNVFDNIAEITAGDIRLPTSGVDYLHLMEEVHMQLFVANVIYFALCFMIVESSDRRIQDFEWCRTTWVEQLMRTAGVTAQRSMELAGTAHGDHKDDRGLQAFKYGRGHFLAKAVPEILEWQSKEPDAFEKIMQSMRVGKETGTVLLADLEEVFTGRFSFCSYLVFNVCYDTIHMVNMGTYTMLSIVLVKLLLAMVHRWGHISKNAISPWLSGICFLFLCLIWRGTVMFKWSLAHEEIQQIPGLSWLPEFCGRISYKVDAGMVCLCTLQVLLFFLCHSWAGHLIDKNYWNAIFQDGKAGLAVLGLFYILSIVVLAWAMPRIIPDYSTVMSLPPFFSYSNQKMIQHVAVQVVDAKMVAAREALAKKLEAKTEAEKQTEGEEGGLEASQLEAKDQAGITMVENSLAIEPSTESTMQIVVEDSSAALPEASGESSSTGSKDRKSPKAKAKKKIGSIGTASGSGPASRKSP